uniref:GIY-YIG domain-containing protein n=1 Tax=Magnusiomyces paraingens TaxID=2606893 RepID=A0A8E5J5S7_9ASCO|nr:hypothetical protein LI423_mgp10 [Saprochaete ingens]QUX32946.1 hypothetical protein [Saprochaete ingens]
MIMVMFLLHNMTNMNIFNNHTLTNKWTGLGLVASTTRYFSTSITKPIKYKPEALALDHINSGSSTTSSVINKMLLNQNMSVTDSKLEELLKVKGVEFDLPIITPEANTLFSELTGKSMYKGFFGVYMFMHMNTGNKYVGSSNLLRRRMDYYFKYDELPMGGKLLPTLKKEGLSAFKLMMFKLDSNKFSVRDALILEQYYLLNKEFNTNTLRVVNAGSSKGTNMFIYDLTCKITYYKANSKIELKRMLKMHPETVKMYLDSKIPYTNKFLLLSFPVTSSSMDLNKMSTKKLLEMMQEERKKLYTLGTRRSISVLLKIKEGNMWVTENYWGQNLNFDSLTSCIKYLRSMGLKMKRDTLSKYMKTEKEFHNFMCKYSDNILPNDFKEIGHIIDEYKQSKDKDLVMKNKKKPMLVKGDNFNIVFNSMTDTIKYFDSMNIKLDRKSLYLHLKDGKPYKGYYFNYK